jgi:hypothetical protein
MLDERASSRALVHVSGIDRISGSGCSGNHPNVRPVANLLCAAQIIFGECISSLRPGGRTEQYG